jgi:hypothetical protein
MREFTRFDRLAKISAIDAEARVVHSRSNINTRGSCKVLQSQLSFVPAYSCVFSFPVYCTLLKLLAIHGVPAELYSSLNKKPKRLTFVKFPTNNSLCNIKNCLIHFSNLPGLKCLAEGVRVFHIKVAIH